MTDPGLCGHCARSRVVESARGTKFVLCGLASRDPRYPKYPRLPVQMCPGYERDPKGAGPKEGPPEDC